MEENIFHLRPFTDVVYNEIAAAPAGLLIHNDTDVEYASAQVPSHKVARRVVCGPVRNGQRFSFALEEDHEIGHAAVVNVWVGMAKMPALPVRVGGEIPQHVLVHFLLQINANRPVAANDLIRANAGVGRNIPAGIGDVDVFRNVADGVVRALNRGRDQAAGEFFA